MSETTPRLSLPLLQAGQAQKEALHNEAILLLDAIVGGTADSVGGNDPPAAPAVGQVWIVGSAPTGDWAGKPDAVAVWTNGGWRFAPAREGMALRVRESGVRIERGATGWSDGRLVATALVVDGEQVVGPRLSSITSPSGGRVADIQARAAVEAILVALKTHGLTAF